MQDLKLKKVLLWSLGLSLIFWVLGYALSLDKPAFLLSKSWLYQVLWLPIHILCAYLVVHIYKTAMRACARETPLLSARKMYLNYMLKKAIISTLIVAPFLVSDGIEGYEMVIDEYSQMGASGWVMLVIWAIEWVATGFLWIHVLLTLKLTVDFYTRDYITKHLNTLLLTNKNSPLLLAGVENSIVVLIYGLATFGYIHIVGGEASDYVALGVSAIFVLLAFIGGLLVLKLRIEKVLDIECERGSIIKEIQSISSPESGQPLILGVDEAQDLAATNSIILEKPAGISKRGFARLRLIKARLLIANNPKLTKHQLALELFKYNEYELRLSTIGMTELRAVLIRLAAPASGILAKLGIFSAN